MTKQERHAIIHEILSAVHTKIADEFDGLILVCHRPDGTNHVVSSFAHWEAEGKEPTPEQIKAAHGRPAQILLDAIRNLSANPYGGTVTVVDNEKVVKHRAMTKEELDSSE